MDVFKEWNEGENLLHVNRPAINSTTKKKKNLHSTPSLDFFFSLVFDVDTKLACGLMSLIII